MKLNWRNCATEPPQKESVDKLYITDGESLNQARYHHKYGWWCIELWDYIPSDLINEYWWADILETISSSSEFEIRRENN